MAAAKKKRGKTQNGRKAAKRGRPTLKTADRVARLTTALKAGCDYRTAALFAGVSERTLRSWREKDEIFSAAMEQASAAAIVGVALRVMKAIQRGEFAAMTFWLEARAPEFKRDAAVAVQVNNSVCTSGPPVPDGDGMREYVGKLNKLVCTQLDAEEDTKLKLNGHTNGTNGTNGTHG